MTTDPALEYPKAWRCVPNPGATDAAVDADRWVRQRLAGPGGPGVAERVGWPFPEARGDRLRAIARFVALRAAHADQLAGGGDLQQAALHSATAGLGARPSSAPLVRAWGELGQLLAPDTSLTWRVRLADRVVAWARAVREAHHPVPARTTPEAHLAARGLTTGLAPMLGLLEYQRGYELPAEVLDDPAMGRLAADAAAVVAIQRDLFAWERDRRAGRDNVVGLLARERRAHPDEAAAHATALHAAHLRSLGQAERALLREHPSVPALLVWIRDLHHLVYGHAEAHARAERAAREPTDDEVAPAPVVMLRETLLVAPPRPPAAVRYTPMARRPRPERLSA